MPVPRGVRPDQMPRSYAELVDSSRFYAEFAALAATAGTTMRVAINWYYDDELEANLGIRVATEIDRLLKRTFGEVTDSALDDVLADLDAAGL